MILDEFALLASDTVRTKAYLQMMIKEEVLPGICVVYSDDIEKMKKEAESYKESAVSCKYFDINIPIFVSLHQAHVLYKIVENKDINSEEMRSMLQGLEQKYLIYSGYGGYILKSPLFLLGKKFVHVHAGILPEYRGSTTIYYSFLQDKTFGATAIFLNEGIDEGEIIAQEMFGIPDEAVDIDYIYEPYLRSKVLMKVIAQYLVKGKLEGKAQEQDDVETYFIIHPVLKHLALLEMEEMRNKNGNHGLQGICEREK